MTHPFFTVTVEPPVHGTLQLVPPLPPDGKYPAGGRFGRMYHEGMSREFA